MQYRTLPLLLAALAAPWVTGAETARPPSIVVFLTDDQGYADVGFQGFPDSADVVTPNLDRLAASGIIFRNGYVASATCGPSRASLMTGRSSSRFNVEDNHHIVPPEERLIPQLIKDRGYVSASIGKWHVGESKSADAIKRGFDFRYGNDSGSGDYFMKDTDDPLVWNSGERQPRAYGRYITDAYMDEASQFILENKDRPFFLYLAFNAPHSPFQVYEDQVKAVVEARPQWKPAYERMKAQGKFPAYDFGRAMGNPDADEEILRLVYITMLMKADEGVGQVLDVLEQEGLRENTLIFYLSDNGAALNRPIDLGGVNKPLRDGKGSVYDGGVRVPYVMSWPAVLPAGTKSDLVVSSMDIFSTTVELAGGKIPDDRIIDGVNLIPFLTGKKEGPAHESLFFRRFARGAWSIRAGDFKYVGGKRERNPDGGLYNIQENLGEDQDLSQKFPERKSDLQTLYRELTKELPVPSPEP